MKHFVMSAAALAASVALAGAASAQATLTSTNGTVQIGINATGELNGGTPRTGLAYRFTGQGGLTGYQDALLPGCDCEAWGVAANGVQGQVGQTTGNANIAPVSSSLSGGTFTSTTALRTLSGLTVTQAYSLSNETATGALFVNRVTIHNGTGAAVTDVRYARAMDWDVPPSEFNEFSTFVGTGTTANLLRSTDNGFAAALPLTGITDPGILGPINADGTSGPGDHGAFFIFGFGDLAVDADYSFNIYYGAGANQTDALALLSAVSPELYNLGQSSTSRSTGSGTRQTDLPTFIFAFNGVGGTVVVPPTSDVPEPASWAMMIGGFGLIGASLRRRRVRTVVHFA